MTQQQVAAELHGNIIWTKTLARLRHQFHRYRDRAYLVAKAPKEGSGKPNLSGGLEEAVQDAVLEAHGKSDHTFANAAQLSAWIYQAAERAMRKKIRANTTRTGDFMPVRPRKDEAGEYEKPEETLDRMQPMVWQGDAIAVPLGGGEKVRLDGDDLDRRIASITNDAAVRNALWDHLLLGTRQADLFAKHGQGRTFGKRAKSANTFEILVKKAKAALVVGLKEYAMKVKEEVVKAAPRQRPSFQEWCRRFNYEGEHGQSHTFLGREHHLLGLPLAESEYPAPAKRVDSAASAVWQEAVEDSIANPRQAKIIEVPKWFDEGTRYKDVYSPAEEAA